MTQADVLFYFPQLCGNVISIKFSENDPRNVIAGGDIRDLPKQEHYGTQPIGVAEKEGLVSQVDTIKSMTNIFYIFRKSVMNCIDWMNTNIQKENIQHSFHLSQPLSSMSHSPLLIR